MENNTPNTNNFLNWVEIKNFKSIKDLRLDCKRVNVFIGKPNVGKSNILEALGVLGAGYDTGKFLKGSARYQNMENLFWDFDTKQSIEIASDRKVVAISSGVGLKTYIGEEVTGEIKTYSVSALDLEEFQQNIGKGRADNIDENYLVRVATSSAKAVRRVDHSGSSDGGAVDNKDARRKFNEDVRIVKKYDFTNLTQFENLFQDFLLPPNGPNLYSVIRRDKELWSEFAQLFTEQQLELVLFDQKREFILQKKDGPYVWQYPFFSIADTFRRFMFYITAIESNKNSVLVLEEPEVHSFPPYVQTLAFRMIESETNQIFVSTHSPYLLQTLIEHLGDDQLNVFVTYYEDYQTKVRALTPEELSEVQEFSIDVFYNLRRFIPIVNA